MNQDIINPIQNIMYEIAEASDDLGGGVIPTASDQITYGEVRGMLAALEHLGVVLRRADDGTVQGYEFGGQYFTPHGDERFALEHTDPWTRGFLTNVHDRNFCEGEHCTIHNRSDHSMRAFPQHWRSDRAIMERTCPCGVGHPDPDSPWSSESYQWVHGCCGIQGHCG